MNNRGNHQTSKTLLQVPFDDVFCLGVSRIDANESAQPRIELDRLVYVVVPRNRVRLDLAGYVIVHSSDIEHAARRDHPPLDALFLEFFDVPFRSTVTRGRYVRVCINDHRCPSLFVIVVRYSGTTRRTLPDGRGSLFTISNFKNNPVSDSIFLANASANPVAGSTPCASSQRTLIQPLSEEGMTNSNQLPTS